MPPLKHGRRRRRAAIWRARFLVVLRRRRACLQGLADSRTGAFVIRAVEAARDQLGPPPAELSEAPVGRRPSRRDLRRCRVVSGAAAESREAILDRPPVYGVRTGLLRRKPCDDPAPAVPEVGHRRLVRARDHATAVARSSRPASARRCSTNSGGSFTSKSTPSI